MLGLKNILLYFFSAHCVLLCDASPGQFALWSSFKVGSNGKKSTDYVTQSVETTDVGVLVQDAVKSVDFVVVLKLSDGKSALSLPAVSTDLQDSHDAVVIPFVYLPTISTSDQSLREQVELNLENPEVVSVDKLKKDFSSMVTTLGTVAKTYVVNLSGDENEHRDLKSVFTLSRDLSVKYLAFSEPKGKAPEMAGEYHRLLISQFDFSANSTWEGGEYSIYYQGKYLYMTPDIFTGMFTGLFFIIILFIGFSCLGAIQGPGTFANKMPTLGKEG